jgi:hypothetical protein
MIVPNSYAKVAACPACGDDMTEQLEQAYEGKPEHEVGGEHDCRACGTVVLVGVFRPEPLFSTHAADTDGVTSLSVERARRGLH